MQVKVIVGEQRIVRSMSQSYTIDVYARTKGGIVTQRVDTLDKARKAPNGSMQIPFEVSGNLPDVSGDGIGFATLVDGKWIMIQ